MKIACDSCSAKYSIADEKVVGRTFKIRCKKCGNAIVVHGEASKQAETFDYGGDASWHVVVDGDQQGPFAPQKLGEMIAANTIGWDAYVWREGFAEWKPAQDVEELVQAIMNPGAAVEVSAKKDAGADLFAARDASPFGGDDDVVASTPSPRAASPAATGQRNENSVLFSLSNLQSLANTAPASAASKPATSATKTTAAGDGSGLIDIRALASATGLTAGSPIASSGAPPRIDDLLSIGAPSVGLGSALAAPVIIAEKAEPARRGGGGIIAAAAIVAVALLGGAGIFAYASLHQRDPAATAVAGAIVPVAAPVPSVVPVPPTSVVVAPPPTTTVEATPPPPSHAEPPSTRVARRTTPPPSSTTPITPPRDTPHAPPSTDLGVLLERAVHTEHATQPDLPAAPSQPDVLSAMRRVQPAVTACGAGEHGVAAVQVSIAGATGRVTNAVVSGQFAGTSVGSCVARAVRDASVPPFRNPTFSVSYPFRI
jgi:predicted Zn finger-like uncharacterized protein